MSLQLDKKISSFALLMAPQFWKRTDSESGWSTVDADEQSLEMDAKGAVLLLWMGHGPKQTSTFSQALISTISTDRPLSILEVVKKRVFGLVIEMLNLKCVI